MAIEDEEIFTDAAWDQYFEIKQEEEDAEEAYRAYLEEMGYI